MVDNHTHEAVTPHEHEADEVSGVVSVNQAVLHTHASNGRVDVVYPHDTDGSTDTTSGVIQTDPHIHAVEHNYKYAVHVGPVPSGSGSVTISNTGSPKLVKRGAAPYKDMYLATKGQNLGNLRLTFEADGTMVKGAGIMISLPAYSDSPLPQFYPDNPSGPAGGVSLADSRSKALAQFSAFPEDGDSDGITTHAVYLTTKRGLEDGNRITVNIRRVILKAHGEAPDKDPLENVRELELSASTASPEATPDPDESPILNNHFELVGGAILQITAPHGSGKMAVNSTALPGALDRAGTDEELGDLEFTFTADGGGMGAGSKVEITIPDAFAAVPFEPASVDDDRSGAVTLSSVADTSLTVAGRVLTAELMGELVHAETLTFLYRKVKAPATEGAYTFKARASSGPHGALTPLADGEQKSVEITGGHGDGTVSLIQGGRTFRQAAKDAQLGNLTFTYTAAGRMAKGAVVQIIIPEGWTSPHHDDGDGVNTAGEVKLTGKADLEITGRPWKLRATTNAALVAGDKLVFTYKSVKAPGAAGSYTFETSAIAFAGALTIDDPGARLESSPSVGIDQAPNGSGTLSVSKSTTPDLTKDATGAYLVKAGESLGDLTLTYTATGKMEIGSSVEITIPGTDDDWPSPSIDNGDGITEAGESVGWRRGSSCRLELSPAER